MSKLAKALSKRIKTMREASKLSQQEVATRGDLSLSLVAKLEQGKKADPRASTLLALARALGVKPGQMLDDLLPAPEEAVANGEPEKEKKKKKKQKKDKAEKKKKKAS
jgi:transcriptional regulator with XRE-family HTH domain